jgi:hypothetical protein
MDFGQPIRKCAVLQYQTLYRCERQSGFALEADKMKNGCRAILRRDVPHECGLTHARISRDHENRASPRSGKIDRTTHDGDIGSSPIELLARFGAGHYCLHPREVETCYRRQEAGDYYQRSARMLRVHWTVPRRYR